MQVSGQLTVKISFHEKIQSVCPNVFISLLANLANVGFPSGQRPLAHSQDNKELHSGQLSECLRMAQSEPRHEPECTNEANLL